MALNIHVSLSQHMPAAHRAVLPGYGRFFDAPNRIVQMIFAGVFDRFPTLDVVVAEVDCGWVPYFKEQIDNNYRRLDAISDFRITARPSEYVDRHLHFTYLTDPFGIANRPRGRGRARSSGRATTRTSRATGHTPGTRSTRPSRTSQSTSAKPSSTATRNASTDSGAEARRRFRRRPEHPLRPRPRTGSPYPARFRSARCRRSARPAWPERGGCAR